MKSTPRPWNADIHDNIFGNGVCVASTWQTNDRPSKANAELIVRAVNYHEKLIEALEKMRAEFKHQHQGTILYELTFPNLDNLLKSARGEE